jgi:hypothetical protein
VEPVRGPILADTPVRGSGIIDAHVPGRPAWLWPGALGRGATTRPGGSGSRLCWLRNEGNLPGGLAGHIAPGQGACWASLHTNQVRLGPRVYTPVTFIMPSLPEQTY